MLNYRITVKPAAFAACAHLVRSVFLIALARRPLTSATEQSAIAHVYPSALMKVTVFAAMSVIIAQWVDLVACAALVMRVSYQLFDTCKYFFSNIFISHPSGF